MINPLPNLLLHIKRRLEVHLASHRRAYTIVVLSFVVKIVVFILISGNNSEQFLANDSQLYLSSARTLVSAGRYSVSPDQINIPNALRPPGYSFFLAANFLLFGENIKLVIFNQIIISLLSLGMIYCIGWKLWNKGLGQVAAALLAFDIVSFTYVFFILSETLFVFILLIFLSVGVSWLTTNEKMELRMVQGGILLGLVTLIRPITEYLYFLMLVGIAVVLIKENANKKLILWGCLLFSLSYFVLVGSWRLRNYAVTGHSQLGQIEGISILYFRAAAVIAEKENISLDESRVLIGAQNVWEKSLLEPEAGWGYQWKKEGLEILLANPIQVAVVTAKGLFSLFSSPGDGHFISFVTGNKVNETPLGDLAGLSFETFMRKWLFNQTAGFVIFAFAVGYLLTIYITAGLGFFYSLKQVNLSATIFLGGVLLYFILVTAGPEATARLRIPIMPLLALYGSVGAYFLVENFRSLLARKGMGKMPDP